MYAEGSGINIQFKIGEHAGKLINIGEKEELTLISDELAGGFNGPFIGMHVGSNGKKLSR